ncbi:MAG: branched-chain amino acid transaminase [Candidatus Diapherotrites archaeon]
MNETEFIWLNGKMVKWREAQTHFLTHSLHYGTAVFEGIRCYDTPKGPAIFRLKNHIERLMNSAKIMQMKHGFTQSQLEGACKEVVKANKLRECYIRPLIFYGYGKMGLDTKGAPVEAGVAAWPWGAYLGEEGIKNGIKARISSYRRHYVKQELAHSKTTGHYTISTLAKMEALNSGYEEAIMLDLEEKVCECTGENLFIVKDGMLLTPPTKFALVGITRDSVMKVAGDSGIEVKEEFFGKEELYSADEAFMTGTAAEVTPIREVDGKTIGKGKPGEITKKLQQKFYSIIHGKEEKYKEWLDFV